MSISQLRKGIGLRSPRLALTVVVPLLGFSLLLRAADPYAAALDKRFENSAPPPRPSDPGVAALENGLKAQARELSQRPEPVPVSVQNPVAPWVLLAGALVGASVVGLVALLALREWNRWLDREATKRLNALADDPLMAEFLRTLHQDSQIMHAEHQTITEAQVATAAPAKVTSEPAVDSSAKRITEVGKTVGELRAELQKLGRATDDAARLKLLREVLVRVESVKESANSAELRAIRLLASALHGLLNQLSLKASNITPSALKTAANAIDLLEMLCKHPPRPDLATAPPVRLLAVDDDAISRRTVSLALKKAFNEPDLAGDGRSGYALAEHQAYDVIFLDIEMPGMDGFELCKKIRTTAPNCTTPVVFVTSHSDFDSRAKSALVGAHDLIGKPFLAFEITVKALTLVLRARQERETKAAKPPPENKPAVIPADRTPVAVSSQRGSFEPASPVSVVAQSP